MSAGLHRRGERVPCPTGNFLSEAEQLSAKEMVDEYECKLEEAQQAPFALDQYMKQRASLAANVFQLCLSGMPGATAFPLRTPCPAAAAKAWAESVI